MGVGNLREWLSARWWWFVAALVVVVIAVVLVWRVSTPPVASVSTPYCNTSQLRARMGPTRGVAGGRVHTSTLTLTDAGRRCVLVGDVPLIQPVRGATHRHVGLGDVPDHAVRPPVTLSHDGSATSLVSVESLPPALFRTCRPEVISGLVIEVGLPVGSTIYVAHRFTGVCSNRLRDNVGAAWYQRA